MSVCEVKQQHRLFRDNQKRAILEYIMANIFCNNEPYVEVLRTPSTIKENCAQSHDSKTVKGKKS